MAVNRLFQIIFLLLEKGSVTAPELAERFEVSVRTIYRDIDTLSAVGIPIYTTPGKGGGIFIEENFVLNKSLISEQEQNQILLALQGMGMVDQENSNALLTKLGGIFNKQNVNWIEIDFSEWNRRSESSFQVLKSAIFQNRVVSFSYYGISGESEVRTVEPLKLVFKSRDWYLYGYCLLRDDYRLFKLDRMRSLQVSEQQFTRSAPEKVLEEGTFQSSRMTSLTLRIDKELAYRAYENFDTIKEQADGSYLVRTEWPDNDGLYGFLLSFGEQIEVLEPLTVRNKMELIIDALKEKYKK